MLSTLLADALEKFFSWLTQLGLKQLSELRDSQAAETEASVDKDALTNAQTEKEKQDALDKIARDSFPHSR